MFCFAYRDILCIALSITFTAAVKEDEKEQFDRGHHRRQQTDSCYGRKKNCTFNLHVHVAMSQLEARVLPVCIAYE